MLSRENPELTQPVVYFLSRLRRKLSNSFAPFFIAETTPNATNHSSLPFLGEFLDLVVKDDAAVTCLAAYAFGTLRMSQENCVISSPLARIAYLFAVIAISTTIAGAWPHKNGQKARVRFLATSTLIRGNWGPNEDTYLAELTFAREGDPLLVRLVDSYPNEAPPLLRAALTSVTGTTFKVRRDMDCDRPYGEMILRTAPGDPMAILLERLAYEPQLRRTPEPDEVLPCYRTVRP
jgi:hypothetical protein